ncbi:MAG: hypothetical protein LUI87_12990 [Lachnospiraceae bacterium]|nr:hypothetical protein [Lachnospiraceae bacterium]
MKKKLVLGILGLGAASLLCGFDSAETAESVMEKMQENAASAENMTSEFDMNFDVSVAIGDGSTTTTIQALVTADLDIAATLDPLATSVTGTFGISTLGTDETIAMQVYMVTEDDDLNAYIYTEDSSYDEEGAGTWQYGSASDLGIDFDLDSLLDMSSSYDYSDLTEWGITFDLASEAADYNGTECYLLSTVIDSANITTILDKAEELAGEELTEEAGLDDETMDMILELLDGLQIKIEYYVDTATYLPAGMHIDLNDTDMTAINTFATEMLSAYFDSEDSDTTTTIEIILNDTSMDYSVSYEDAVEITVPQEAYDAIASGEAENLGDLEVYDYDEDYDDEYDYDDDTDEDLSSDTANA